LWLQGVLQSRNSDHVAVRDVLDNGRVNWDEFGIEEEDPVPALEDTETVVVPESPIRLIHFGWVFLGQGEPPVVFVP